MIVAAVSPEERLAPYTSTGIVIAFPLATFAVSLLSVTNTTVTEH